MAFLHIVQAEAPIVFVLDNLQGCLYREQPWKIEIVSPTAQGSMFTAQYKQNNVSSSGAKGRHAYCPL